VEENQVDETFDPPMSLDEAASQLSQKMLTANNDQAKIFQTVVDNSHLCMHVILGSAGVGKSYLLDLLRLKYTVMGYTVIALAPTGIAARNIRGQTIHRFFGISDEFFNYNAVTVESHFKNHLHKKTILLIDECSMISLPLLAAMNEALVMVMHFESGNEKVFLLISFSLFLIL
jgi:replication-associated recombination protein RarA